MKKLLLISILSFSFIFFSCQKRSSHPSDVLKGIDPVKAMEIANEWHYTKRGVRSLVNAQFIVFEFPDGKKVTISLPEDRMVVAIAPYINSTHL